MLDKTIVIIPSLDPDEHLVQTVEGLKAAGFNRFVLVDDGSDEEHKKNFPEPSDSVAVLHHEKNKGKGAALKTAFSYIAENLPDAKYMVTVDGDGQHAPLDAKKCIEALGDNENLCILGARSFKEDNVPLRSKMGNTITLFVFHKLCGIKISDTQTGLRAFSTALIPALLRIEGDRFEYETNMLLKFKQNGVEIGEVPIETVYIEENHASHFRTVQDSFLVYKFILSYVLSSAISFIVDISLFAILLKIFTKSGITGPAFALFGKEMTLVQFFATAIARAVSSIVNYTINKKKVFTYEKADEQKKDNTIFKYYALAIPQMFVSAFSVTLLVRLLHIPAEATFVTTLLKVCVDVIIFLVNYRVQRSWVFANRPSDNKELGGKNNE